ncbi:MAG: protein kinase [Gemmatimonadetes bacterium]|nr:protein kinase [Gemmatimonadota bacterium]
MALRVAEPNDKSMVVTTDPDELMDELQRALEGRYVLEGELGRGGMGIVYLAWESGLGRHVALKLLRPEFARSSERRQRFLDEARIAASLMHKYIVPIYTVEETPDGRFSWFTMAYVEGETLASRVRREGPLPAAETARILRDVALGLEYAHGKGVVHRDMTPWNIMMEAGGRVLITDFGLARLFEEDVPPDGGSGTPYFLSPEQILWFPADPRSDLYALGVTGFVIASGDAPFSGTDSEVARRQLTETAPSLQVSGDAAQTILSRAVARCLERDPGYRFQSAAELAATLSLIPALMENKPDEWEAFLDRTRAVSQVVTVVGVTALVAGYFASVPASGPLPVIAGLLALLALIPLVGIAPVTRLMLASGYSRTDIEELVEAEIGRQGRAGNPGNRKPPPAPPDRKRPAWIVVAALGVFGLSLLIAVVPALARHAPVNFLGRMIFAAIVTFAFAAGILWWRSRRHNRVIGARWIRFWRSPLGAGMVKLCGVGLQRPRLARWSLEFPESRPVPALPAEPSAWRTEVITLSKQRVSRARSRLEELSGSAVGNGQGVSPIGHARETISLLTRQVAILEGMLAELERAGGNGHAKELAGNIGVVLLVGDAIERLVAEGN